MSVTRRSDCGAIGLDQKGVSEAAIFGFKNLHEYRYDVRALTERGLWNGVIYVIKRLSKDSTLDQKII